MTKFWIWFLIVVATIVVALKLTVFKGKSDEVTYETATVKRGNIRVQVQASGTIEPINVVNVGTQVSGIIEKIYVDFNDQVEKGQVLAELDRAILLEDMNETIAQVYQTEAKYKTTQLNLKRVQELFKEKYISKAELEQAEVELAVAKASYDTAVSKQNKARRNLGYAKITSPVSGTVISREVETGQTVAASFQTPTLFKIAEDLKKMQIETSIAEADIGMIKIGQAVNFTVDAYVADRFQGKVGQIRLNPVKEQNVVMYTVVINIDNSDGRLLPGMTAFVSVEISEKLGVLRVPSPVFQYKPRDLNAGKSGSGRPERQSRPRTDGASEEPADPNKVTVYLLKDGQQVPTKITKGMASQSFTEIVDGLKEGDVVITEAIVPSKR